MIAIVAMTIDHVGMFLLPEYTFMRIIGRFTMPIMCYFVAQGVRHTRDIDRYARRMLIFALITVLPYYALTGVPGNVMFTFLSAILGLKHAQQADFPTKSRLILALFALLPTVLVCDWIGFGTIMVYIFYYAKDDKLKTIKYFAVLCSVVVPLFALSYYTQFFWDMVSRVVFNINILWALPLIFLYNGKRGPNLKYLFYAYYPLHIFVILLLRQ